MRYIPPIQISLGAFGFFIYGSVECLRISTLLSVSSFLSILSCKAK